MALATSLGTVAGPAGAQTAPLSLTVVIHNYATAPQADLEQARTIATRIYRRMDVRLDWWDTSCAGAEVLTDPAAPPAWPATAIHVRLNSGLADRRRVDPRALGFAASGTRLATVLVTRVEQLAINNRLNVAELLGVVIAHEVGHLLLPPNSHTAGGIMSPDLDLFGLAHGESGSISIKPHRFVRGSRLYLTCRKVRSSATRRLRHFLSLQDGLDVVLAYSE